MLSACGVTQERTYENVGGRTGGGKEDQREPASQEKLSPVASLTEALEIDSAIRSMEPHVQVLRGQLVLDVDDAVRLGLQQSTFDTLKVALERTNLLLRSGRITLAEIHLDVKDPATLTKSLSTSMSLLNCAGRSGVVSYWYGTDYYLNSCETGTVGALCGKGVAEAVAALCPEVPWTCPFAVVVVAYSCWMNAANHGRGVILKVRGPVGWVESQ
jgi:hypothetical protein